MRLPVQSGMTVRDSALVPSYPINLELRTTDSGVSAGQIVTTRGARDIGTGPGNDRGGTAWRGECYRVMGDKLVTVGTDGTVTELGNVADNGLTCRFTYSFDQLAIVSAERLYYYNGEALTEVTDPDLGRVADADWIDGYFATTDGEFVVVTELNDPTAVEPLKYGSAESDPDPVVAVRNLREELLVVGRHSIQTLRNVGGNGFPFANVRGAMVPFGAISARAVVKAAGTLAFVGGQREQPLAVYLLGSGAAARISDETIEAFLADSVPEAIEMETRRFNDEEQLLIHTDKRTLCINLATSSEIDTGAWSVLQSGNFGPYRPRHAVYVAGQHIVGDPRSAALAVLREDTDTQFGQPIQWLFDAGMAYGDGRGFVLNEIELVGQSPRKKNSAFLSLTRDGEIWSNEVAKLLGGQRNERCIWRPGVRIPEMVGARLRGTGRWGIARLNVAAEPLNA